MQLRNANMNQNRFKHNNNNNNNKRTRIEGILSVFLPNDETQLIVIYLNSNQINFLIIPVLPQVKNVREMRGEWWNSRGPRWPGRLVRHAEGCFRKPPGACMRQTPGYRWRKPINAIQFGIINSGDLTQTRVYTYNSYKLARPVPKVSTSCADEPSCSK